MKKESNKMGIRVEAAVPNVIVVTMDSRYELGMTFVRLQEFYDGKQFKGKVFALEDVMDWWAEHFGGGTFNYPNQWDGFNLPGKVFYRWWKRFKGKKGGLRWRERLLVKAVCKYFKGQTPAAIRKKLEQCYIIGVFEQFGRAGTITVNHELAHAIYYLYPAYRRGIMKLLLELERNPKTTVKFRTGQHVINRLGYHSSAQLDELQAYFATETAWRRQTPQFNEYFEDFMKGLRESEGHEQIHHG